MKIIEKKQIQKSSRREQRTFYKYYSDKIKHEHPRWSTSQVLNIVVLLWKKHEMVKGRSAPRWRKFKAITARMAFRVSRSDYHEGMSPEKIQQINQRFKRLPKESRIFWKKQGMRNFAQETPEKSYNHFKIMRSSTAHSGIDLSMESTEKGFNFMKNLMFWMEMLSNPRDNWQFPQFIIIP